MSATVIISTIVCYFLALIAISIISSRKSSNATFFSGDKESPWYLVAYGMIGASLSGVTFISIPGKVGSAYFSYFIIVVGYVIGYIVIAEILLPLYYKKKLVSIYTYLGERFGSRSYKTGASFFLLSRIIGASFRLFLVADVLYKFIFSNPAFFDEPMPFWVAVLATVVLIWIYTFRGGIKTIVWTDTLQTTFMLGAVVLSIVSIAGSMNISVISALERVFESDYSSMFQSSGGDVPVVQLLLTGMFITIVMTGLDQDMMQKNLTIDTLKNARKNMYSFTAILVIVNLIFLILGALLYLFATSKGIAIPDRADRLFPTLALNHFSITAGIFFLLGIISAAYSSADSALAALTTSFSIDILNEDTHSMKPSKRYVIHFGFSIVLFLVILFFQLLNDESIIDKLFKAAGYTYGPLLGLYSFGLFTTRKVDDRSVPIICLFSSTFSYFFYLFFAGTGIYDFGFTILIVNGLITFFSLFLVPQNYSKTRKNVLLWIAYILLLSFIVTNLTFNFTFNYSLPIYFINPESPVVLDGIATLLLIILIYAFFIGIDQLLNKIPSTMFLIAKLTRITFILLTSSFVFIIIKQWNELAKVYEFWPMIGCLVLVCSFTVYYLYSFSRKAPF